jgi:uncharacterized protein
MALSLEQVRNRRTEILSLAAHHGAHNVRIFCSVARGEMDPSSDVDVLVDFEPGRSLIDLVALQQDLSDLLGLPVDVVSGKALGREDRILAEALAL